MARRKPPISFGEPLPTYGNETHRPLNQLALIGPLLLIFTIGSIFTPSSLLVPEYMRVVLLWFGASGRFLSAGLILFVLYFQHLVRRDPTRVDGWAVMGMVVESALWLLPLLAISWITTQIPGQMGPASPSRFQQLLECLGAGIYEEFVFRMVLVSLGIMLFTDLMGLAKLPVTVGSILAAAVAFSLCHFSFSDWTGASAFRWDRFTFLALAGAWWGLLYVWRGYAVAACSHIWWNFLVVAFNG